MRPRATFRSTTDRIYDGGVFVTPFAITLSGNVSISRKY